MCVYKYICILMCVYIKVVHGGYELSESKSSQTSLGYIYWIKNLHILQILWNSHVFAFLTYFDDSTHMCVHFI